MAFDAAKESMHILSLSEPVCDGFRILGVDFDAALETVDAVAGLVTDAGWKLRTLLRARRFCNDADQYTCIKHIL